MHILVVDDDPAFNAMLTTFLKRNNYDVSVAHSSQSALSTLQKQAFDLVLTDFKLPDMDGLALIQRIKTRTPDLPVILITNYSDIRTAVSSIKLGAYEFVTKPVIPDELLVMIRQAVNAEKKDKVAARKSSRQQDTYIIGKNKASVQVWEHVEMVAPTNLSVLITGESGTGKEYVARMLHQKSRRSDQAFIAIDCGVLSRELAGSELFGHVKGAFTGASNDKKGHFELANKGTIFLDEVGNLPYDVQVKLLRAIQERKIRRLGSEQVLDVDVRIIAATNELMKPAIESDMFRNDLYHRLNEFELRLPALAERTDDIEEYALFFMKEACNELEKHVERFTPDVLEVLKKYSWPGNLRELKNIITRAVLLSPGLEVTLASLPEALITNTSNHVVEQHHAEGPSSFVNNTDLKALKETQERALIIKMLIETKYNKSKTANLLNIDRKTLYAKIKQYDIDA